ncbi:hypothetical protein JB92DRAFT_2862786 [Gautieria morchelliformis]|nr:hypothetical protein JB92DRAFT_2862786 [Gautieria morchelliformis]
MLGALHPGRPPGVPFASFSRHSQEMCTCARTRSPDSRKKSVHDAHQMHTQVSLSIFARYVHHADPMRTKCATAAHGLNRPALVPTRAKTQHQHVLSQPTRPRTPCPCRTCPPRRTGTFSRARRLLRVPCGEAKL